MAVCQTDRYRGLAVLVRSYRFDIQMAKKTLQWRVIKPRRWDAGWDF